MPRGGSGYDPAPVCAFCIDNLTSGSISLCLRAHLICCTVTAGSRNHLKSLSLGKLKKYADAYNLRSDQIIEKDELVDRLMSYRVSSLALPNFSPIHTPRRHKTGVCLQATRYVMRHPNLSMSHEMIPDRNSTGRTRSPICPPLVIGGCSLDKHPQLQHLDLALSVLSPISRGRTSNQNDNLPIQGPPAPQARL